jgi:apolipoprotein D and lipocalin family protein
LWFLSRTPTVSEADKQRFIQAARAKGFDTDELIFVEQ